LIPFAINLTFVLYCLPFERKLLLNFMKKSTVLRRDFLRMGGASAALLGTSVSQTDGKESAASLPSNSLPPETKFPKLAMITRYSPSKLAFAASAGYEGVVISVDDSLDPDRLSDSQIQKILDTAKQAGVRVLSLECFEPNHIARDTNQRRDARARFVRCLEMAHRLGCKFVGTFSGGMLNVPVDEQLKELAAAINEQYLPVCEKLDLRMGFENWPGGAIVNFATVPAVWEKLMTLVPNRRFGLEFDPSHLVWQFIDPIQAAWEFRDRILAVHAKDTEIVQPVLAKVGIQGTGWWRYRIPGQGLVDWPKFINVLLQAEFRGGMAVEHEDPFWDEAPSNDAAEFPQARKDGFIIAARFLRQYLPGRPSPESSG
jgi:sugar phosphate isomerase/epimerase